MKASLWIIGVAASLALTAPAMAQSSRVLQGVSVVSPAAEGLPGARASEPSIQPEIAPAPQPRIIRVASRVERVAPAPRIAEQQRMFRADRFWVIGSFR